MRFFKKGILLFLLIISVFIVGCVSVRVDDADVSEMYSREDVDYMSESSSFGKGRTDDVYVALKYIYANEEIREKHGDSFEITVNDVVCHNSETENFFILSLYKGHAEYSITVEDSTYRFKLSKSYFGRWTVIE